MTYSYIHKIIKSNILHKITSFSATRCRIPIENVLSYRLDTVRIGVKTNVKNWREHSFSTMVHVLDEMVQKDLPQAIQMFGEMNASVDRVNQLIDIMLNRVKNDEISTAKGLSFSEVKYHMLLSYLINLTYIVLKKSSGEQIHGDPSIERLIEIRTVLEKIRPIDYKLKYQIDKLVKSTVMGATGETNLTSFKANPDAFLGKIEESNEDSDEVEDHKAIGNTKKLRKSGVYAPPKLAAVHYDGDETTSEKIRNAGERSRKRAVSTAILRELKEEYLDAPIEDSQASERKMSLCRENKRKIEYEENYMTRLPVGKQEKHRNRQFSTLNTLGDEITTFGGSLSSKNNKRKHNNDKGKKRFKKKRFT